MARDYYTEATAINLNDSLQYAAEDPWIEGNDQSNAFQAQESSVPFSDGMAGLFRPEGDADLMMGGTSYPFTLQGDVDTSEIDAAPTDTGQSFQLPNDPSAQDGQQNSTTGNNTVSAPFLSHQTSQSHFAPVDVSNFTSNTPSVSTLPHLSLFDRHVANVPTQGDIRSSVIPAKPSAPNSHHFVISENISREYYGSDPMAPRLLTSGMVRRTPSRQPIKSLDLDPGTTSTSTHPQRYLKTNDRSAVLSSKERYDNGTGELGRENVLASSRGRSTEWKTNPAQGAADLMAFHSRQSRMERVADTMAITAPTRGSKLRQKV